MIIPKKKRNELAGQFVGELSDQWSDENEPDYDDLNRRLGLL